MKLMVETELSMMDNSIAPVAAAASVTPVLLVHSMYGNWILYGAVVQHLIKFAAYCIQSVLQIIYLIVH